MHIIYKAAYHFPHHSTQKLSSLLPFLSHISNFSFSIHHSKSFVLTIVTIIFLTMSPTNIFAILVIFSSAIFFAFASDPDTLQDLCVALPSLGVKVNGFACKDEANVTAADFFFDGLAKPGVINNTVGSVVIAANVEKIPGLNTLGVSLSRIDYKAGGLNPPHTHPRATEIVFVLEGQLDVGFITTANKLISKIIKEGEIFVFPKGLVHFQKNNGDKPAAVISAFNSQLPGTLSIAAALFTATPTVPDDVLTLAFQIGTKEVDNIKTNLSPKKN